MARLTEKDEQGNWRLKGIDWSQLHTGTVITKEVHEKLYGALYKLMRYEDTGLSPEDVSELREFISQPLNTALPAFHLPQWIPVEEQLPDPDDYILVSFDNFSLPMIGRYTVDDDDGGTFRIGDEDESFLQHDLFVNDWMPLPEAYKGQD